MSPTSPTRRPLRFLDLTLPGVDANLALDEALLQECEDDGAAPALRLWELPGLAVVLGASGRIHEDVHVDLCRADGVAIARRSSGGGTVLIGPGALNVTVVLPIEHHPDLATVEGAQRHVLEHVAEALRSQGTPAEVLGSGDLTLGGRKFAGSAQRRVRRHVLVHASILYDFPLAQIARYTAEPRRQPVYRDGRTHDRFVTNLGWPRDRLAEALQSAWLDPASPFEPALPPLDRVRDLLVSKFSDPAWIERF